MRAIAEDAGSNDRLKGRLPLVGSIVLLACALPAVLFGGSTVAAIDALHALAKSPSPYFIPDRALLLYVAAPLVTLSACVLLLAPGLFVALRFRRGHAVADLILTGFTLSFAIVSVAASLGQILIGRPLVGGGFAWLIFALAAIALVFTGLVFTARDPRASPRSIGDRSAGLLRWPFAREDGEMLGVAAAMVGISVIAFLPKLFWENFNGDGAHMFETARLLLRQPLPFWPASAGELTTFPSMKSVLAIYPTSWFLRLFGSDEAGARLPYLFLLGVLFCAMTAVIEEGLARRLRWLDHSILAGALLLFTLVMAFSATEDPYLADLALPGVQDVLLMIFWCGFMLHFLRGNPAAMVGYVACAYLTSPNAVPLLGAWCVAALISIRPVPRSRLVAIVLAILALMILEGLLAKLIAAIGLPAPGTEHATSVLILRLLHPQVSQVIRFAWAFLPVGLLPGIALLMWRWQDAETRTIAVCALIMFAFYYLQFRFSLHYFAPVMILSLIVLWRMLIAAPESSRAVAAAVTVASLVLCLALSWPSDLRVAMSSREVGEEIEDRTSPSGDPRLFGRINDVLQALFPRPADPRVPSQVYGGHPLVWLHYAHVPADAPHTRNYILQWKDAPPVPGARKIAEDSSAALYVRDDRLWETQAARRLPDPTGAQIYVVPRETLFTTGPHLAALRWLKDLCLRERAWCPMRKDAKLHRSTISSPALPSPTMPSPTATIRP